MEEKKTKFYKKKWFIALVIVVIVIALFSGGESTDTSSTDEQESNQTEEKYTEKESEDSTYMVGDTATYNDVEYTVSSIEKSNGTEFETPTEGKEYVIITVEITNNSDDTVAYNDYFDYTMQNSNGQITSPEITTIDSDTALSSGELASGGSISGTLVFMQPVDDSELELIITPNMLSDDEIHFAIK